MERMRFFMTALLAAVLLAGCKTVKYVPLETVRTDSVTTDRWHRDSVYLRDSVFVNRWTAGDTVYQDKVVYKYLYRDKVRYDTVAITRRDSVEVPYPVEKELSWWQNTQIYGFRVLAVLLVAVLAWKSRNQIMSLIRKLT